MLDDGSMSARKVSWFRINMEDSPEMVPPQVNQDDGDQVVIGKLGQKIALNYEKKHDEPSENVDQFVSMFRELTGDFVTHIECSDIQDEDNTERRNEIIYYGPEGDLSIGGPAEVLLNLAIGEVYQYRNPLDRTWISWNNEPACRKGLDSEKSHMGFFNGKGFDPLFIEYGSTKSVSEDGEIKENEPWPSLDKLKRENNFRSVLNDATWNRRAHESISVNRLPFLVLFVPGLRNDSDDWRVKLAAEVNERLKAEPNPSQTFILCQPYHTDEAEKLEGMDELS